MTDAIPPSSASGPPLGPAVAGRWYPADPDRLAEEVDRLLDEAARGPAPRPCALVSPHAGYVYSGAVAASVFAAVRGHGFRRVVLIGTSHYEGYRGARVPGASALSTPLGELPLDRPVVERLAAARGFAADDRPFRPEHTLESQLPFLQRCLPAGFRLVPVLIGGPSRPADLDRIADELRPVCDTTSLLIASSDFTHYGRAFGYVPFEGGVADRLRELDLGAADLLLRLDEPGFARYVARTGATICGQTAIRVLLRLLPADCQSRLAAYDNSGRMTGDWSHAVSYAGLLFSAPDRDR